MAPSTTPQLDSLLRAGDHDERESAWADFVEAHSRVLLAVASARRGGYDATMDRYSYILEKLREQNFRRLRTYRAATAQFSSWLAVVGRRLCSDFDRERYGRFRNPASDGRAIRRALVDLVPGLTGEDEQVPASGDPAESAVQADQDGLVQAAVAALPADDRLLLRLRYEDDLSVQEIRAILGFPTVFHVYRRLKALHEQLRSALVRRGIRSTTE